jgi:acyl-coenzyme A synthetase/AMP-(fatty) acid ligase
MGGGLIDTYQPQLGGAPRARAGVVRDGKEVLSLGEYVLLARAVAPAELHPDLALLMTTSGSTGSPKFVRQSYRNIDVNARAIAEYLGIDGDDRPITTLPMNYVYGLSVLNSHLVRGASIVVTGRSLAEKPFWELLRDRRATSMAGVPYTYELMKRLRVGQMDLPSLDVLTQAGGKLNPVLVEEFARVSRDKGIRFFVMYGAAEATARMSYLPADRALEKTGSIGIAIPGGQFWIEDEHGAVVETTGHTGELVYRGENVAMGYATRREDLALGDERGGVLRTGDLARRDEDGFYYVVGRRSRFVKLFGNRVSLEDVEHLVRAEGIDCACTGDEDVLRIFITDAARREFVVGLVQERTGIHRSAYRVNVIDRIPRNETGKVTYAALPRGA